MITDERQNQIISEFELLGDDRESAIFYIMDLGAKLPALDPAFKIDDFAIKGCQSKAWLVPRYDQGRMDFLADSNTDLVKGLLFLITSVYSGLTPEQILQTRLYFPERIGLHSLIGTQRSNGVAAVLKLIEIYAKGHINN